MSNVLHKILGWLKNKHGGNSSQTVKMPQDILDMIDVAAKACLGYVMTTETPARLSTTVHEVLSEAMARGRIPEGIQYSVSLADEDSVGIIFSHTNPAVRRAMNQRDYKFAVKLAKALRLGGPRNTASDLP